MDENAPGVIVWLRTLPTLFVDPPLAPTAEEYAANPLLWHHMVLDEDKPAVLKDAAKVRFVPLNSQQRFAALQSGEIDVLSRNTTWTLTRDASLGIVFTGIDYYDGQGFMVPKKLKVDSALKLGGAQICVQAYNDLNGDGQQGADETLMAGVAFTLSDAGGPRDAYTTDGTTEPHCFQDLKLGNYQLTIKPPANYGSTTPDAMSISLSAGVKLSTKPSKIEKLII